MYSQCPQCQAIFSVSEAHVSAHHGLVRCGNCRAIFHAVTNEVADPHAPEAGEPAPVQRDIEEAASERSAVPIDEPEPPAATPAPEESPPPVLVEPAITEPAPESIETAPADEVSAPEEWPPPVPVEAAVTEPVPESIDAPPETLPADEELEAEDTGDAQVPDMNADRAEAGQAETPAGDEPESGVGKEDELPADSMQPAAPPPGDGAAPETGEGTRYEDEVEEILIEAPPVLWNAFDDDFDGDGEAKAARHTDGETATEDVVPPHGRARSGGKAAGWRPASRSPDREGDAAGGRAPLKSPYRARDIRMVELPQPRPFKTMSLSLVAVLLVLLLFWQAKAFYLDELAQLPVLRPHLERLCRPLGCVVPPRQNFAQIDLVGTSISLNPEVPGALEIKASLINRAHFPQPYPLLRITLTDREGRVVGRRTYLPSEYRDAGDGELLPIKEIRDVSINLAQPAENAVGYEVELVAPHSENS